MMKAIVEAELGDDVLGDDPTIHKLERRIAELLGMESAIFTPSGTMANQLAIRSVCEAGDEILCHRDSHILHYETAAPAALSGCMVLSIEGDVGLFSPDSVTSAIRPKDQHAPRSRMLVVENTVNRAGGTTWTIDAFRDVAAAAHAAGLHVHVDGARLWNACVAIGYEPRDFLAAGADSVSVCFSKGLGAPVGSALAGSAAMLARAKRFRKMFGGAMRQSGLLAAAALHAIDHHVERLIEDHANAIRLAAGLAAIPGVEVEACATRRSDEHGLHADRRRCARLLRASRRAWCGGMIPMGAGRIRAVTHLDVDESGIDRAIAAVRAIAAG